MASNTIDQALNVYIKASTQVQDEIGTRFFYIEAERDAAYPYAVCFPISDPHDPGAWFDSDSGDRTLTIQAVEAIPSFEREFPWDKQPVTRP